MVTSTGTSEPRSGFANSLLRLRKHVETTLSSERRQTEVCSPEEHSDAQNTKSVVNLDVSSASLTGAEQEVVPSVPDAALEAENALAEELTKLEMADTREFLSNPEHAVGHEETGSIASTTSESAFWQQEMSSVDGSYMTAATEESIQDPTDIATVDEGHSSGRLSVDSWSPVALQKMKQDVIDIVHVLACDGSKIPLDQQRRILKNLYDTYEPELRAMASLDIFRDKHVIIHLVTRLKSAHKTHDAETFKVLLTLAHIFTRPDKNCELYSREGGVKCLISTLVSSSEDADVLWHTLSALGNLCKNQLSRSSVKTFKPVPSILACMKIHREDVRVIRAGLSCLEEIVTEFPAKVGHAAVRETLMAMRKYINDAGVQSSGCGTLWRYSIGNFLLYVNKRFVGSHGGIATILSAMSAHPRDRRTQFKALGALHSLILNIQCRIALRHYDPQLKIAYTAMANHPSVKSIQEMGRSLIAREEKSRPKS